MVTTEILTKIPSSGICCCIYWYTGTISAAWLSWFEGTWICRCDTQEIPNRGIMQDLTFSQQCWWRFPVFWDMMPYRLVYMYVFSVYSISANTEHFINPKITNF